MAKLKDKRTSITTVPSIFGSFAIFATPLISHWSLISSQCWGSLIFWCGSGRNVKLYRRISQPHGSPWIWVTKTRSRSAFKIRIRIQERKNDPKQYKNVKKFHVSKCWMFFFEHWRLFYRLGVLYGGPWISKMLFYPKILISLPVKLFGHWSLKPWIRN